MSRRLDYFRKLPVQAIVWPSPERMREITAEVDLLWSLALTWHPVWSDPAVYGRMFQAGMSD